MTGLPSEVFDRIGGGVRTSAPAASADTSTLVNPQAWFTNAVTGAADGGIPVGPRTGYQFAPLVSVVSLIAQVIASLPCKVFQKRADGGQDEVSDHPAYGLLQREYNGNTSAYTGRNAEVGHLLTWGNAYAQVVRNGRGELLELRPLGPDVVRVGANDANELEYHVAAYDRQRESRDEVTLRRREVLHTPYLSFDALVGFSPIVAAKGTVRTGLAQDRQAERFVLKGMRAPGALRFRETKTFKTVEEARAFRERWNAIHGGSESDLEIPILEDGAEWVKLGTDPATAQLLESRQFTRGEIAGLYHVPPHLIGDTEKTTGWGTGIEEQNIAWVVYCLLPIMRAIEQEKNRKLFDPQRYPADEGLFVEHVLAGLLRGDSKKLSETIKSYMLIGLLTVNEARKLLGWNPIGGGNVRLTPLNMLRTDDTGRDLPMPEGYGKSGGSKAAAARPRDKAARKAARVTAAAFRKVLARDVGRLLRKESLGANAAAKKPAEFGRWVEAFYAKIADQVRELFDTPLTAGFAERHLARSKADLLAASECQPADLADRVAACVEKWHTDRVADLVSELSEGFAHAV